MALGKVWWHCHALVSTNSCTTCPTKIFLWPQISGQDEVITDGLWAGWSPTVSE